MVQFLQSNQLDVFGYGEILNINPDLKKDENWNFVKDENWKNIKEFMPLWVERYDSKQILEADKK